MFTYRWYDNFEYDLVFGARYNSTGSLYDNGFAGIIREI